MKALTSAVISTLLATGVLMANTAAADSQGMEQCKTEVANYYGGVMEVKYVDQRRFREGIQMKFAVNYHDAATQYTTTRMANCRLSTHSQLASIVEDDASMAVNTRNALASSMVVTSVR